MGAVLAKLVTYFVDHCVWIVAALFSPRRKRIRGQRVLGNKESSAVHEWEPPWHHGVTSFVRADKASMGSFGTGTFAMLPALSAASHMMCRELYCKPFRLSTEMQ